MRKAILEFRDLTQKIKDDHAMKIADLDIPDEFLGNNLFVELLINDYFVIFSD